VYYVYALNGQNRKYIYIGLTNNISRRVKQHQLGKEQTTSPYRPFKLILVGKCKTRPEARQREKYLKSGVGKEWIKKYIIK